MNLIMSPWFWYPLITVAFLLVVWSTLASKHSTVRIPRRVDTYNLATATAQEVFDWVVYNLRLQNRKSLNANGTSCMYRGIENTRCAGGWLIADDHYSCDMEGTAWVSLSLMLPDTARHNPHEKLITALQEIHDTEPFVSYEVKYGVWRSFERLGQLHGLDTRYVTCPI